MIEYSLPITLFDLVWFFGLYRIAQYLKMPKALDFAMDIAIVLFADHMHTNSLQGQDGQRTKWVRSQFYFLAPSWDFDFSINLTFLVPYLNKIYELLRPWIDFERLPYVHKRAYSPIRQPRPHVTFNLNSPT
jgi:hypothetical protein